MIEDVSQLTNKQVRQLNSYLEEHCTSRCQDDMDCPHESEFIDILNRELEAIRDLDFALNN